MNDRFFKTIDTEAKAYLLGWIASDGSIRRDRIAIYIHSKDGPTLARLRDSICAELPVAAKRNTPLVGFTICSSAIVNDVCRWLEITPGKKDAIVGFPDLPDESLSWAFIRGVFDGDGSISSLDAALKRTNKAGWPSPRCSIASSSDKLLDAIALFTKIPAYRGKGKLEWQGSNALDLLGKLYAGAGPALARKRDLYLDWCSWVPSRSGQAGGAHPLFRWTRVLAQAIPPTKRGVSDSGFDLTLIALEKRIGAVEFYRTGIRVQPAFGWYFDLVARSSISKTGYMLANGVGVIDRGYVGEILVPLIKVDPGASALPLPARLVQIIPRPIIAAELVEVDSFDDTLRGSGGFGSTGA